MELPIDVILSVVLPKLPSKSLMRFKLVCRSFNTTISSSEFINDYLSPCLSSDVNSFLILPRTDGLYSYNLDSQESPLFTNLHLPSTFNSLSGYVSMIGSCNGLLCISKEYLSTRHFVVLNPSTGKFWEIPFDRFFNNQLILNSGFGYDAANGDYKIVSFYDDFREIGAEMRGVRVYSLKAGSWRQQVESSIRAQDRINWTNSVVLLGNDLLHCVFTSLNYQERLPHIGCFDIGSETWRENVMLPMYYDEHGYHQFEAFWNDIGVLDECLCSTFRNMRVYKFDVWIMEEHGVSESWVCLYSILLLRLPAGIIHPLACRKGSKDEVLLMVNSPILLWYNRLSDEIVKVELKEVPEIFLLRAWICVGNPGDYHIGTPV